MGRIVTIVLVIVLIVGGVWWWRNYHSVNLYDGSVVRRDAAMENGTTTMENGQNIGEVHPTPSRSDAPGTINGDPYRPTGEELGTQTTPITHDPYAQGGAYASSGPYGASGQYGSSAANGQYGSSPAPSGQYGSVTPSGTVPPPRNNRWPHWAQRGAQEQPQVSYGSTAQPYPSTMVDSQAPNAPNGARFGGSGNFQWYRQGSITYRVNTQTGSSCIAYATTEEWRRPDVHRHACHAS